MNNIERKVFNGLIGASMVGGALAGCAPTKMLNTNPNADVEKNPTQTQVLTPEEIDEIQGNSQDFINTQPSTMEGKILEEKVEADEIVQTIVEQEEKEFDYSVLDIKMWND